MRRIKGLVVLTFSLILAGSLFSIFRALSSPDRLQTSLVTQIEERLGAQLSYEHPKIIFTPLPHLRMEKPSLKPSTERISSFTADEIQFSFQFLPLLWGRFRIAGFRIRNGEGEVEGIPLTRIDFRVKGLGSNGTSSFEGRASGFDEQEILRGKGGFNLQSRRENLWAISELKGDFTLNHFKLPEGLGKSLPKRLPQAQVSGTLEGKLHIEKEKGKNIIVGLVDFESKNFQSGNSERFSLTAEGKFNWNLENHSIEFEQVTVKSPFAELEGRGLLNIETGEIGEVRLTGRKVTLEELARHFPNLKSILPLDTGFSGQSEFDLTLQGTWDYLTLHTNWDLTPAVITYRKIFSKPKDFPMVINSDLLLKKGSLLSGDFSVRIGQMMAKGAIVGFDFGTREGELTLLTNKFELKSWKTLLNPFTDYRMSGSAKVLLNWKGELDHLEKAERAFNLTLEDVTLLSPQGHGIRNMKLLLDSSGLILRIKNTHFEVEGSPVKIEAEIYDLNQSPQGAVVITSPELDLFALAENLKTFSPFFLPEKKKETLKKLKSQTEQFLPKTFVMKDLAFNLKVQQGKVTIENFNFQAFDGTFVFRAEMDWPAERPSYWVEIQVDRASLARYFEGMESTEKIFEGNFFFQGKFQGESAKPEEIFEKISGQGRLSITNGDWDNLDLMGPVSSLWPFESLSSYPLHSTPFHDLKAAWKFEKGKFDTSDFLLHSDEFWVEGEGKLSLEGVLNSRLQVYLSKALTEKLLKTWGWGKPEGKQVGPLPFLLIGNLTKSEVRADDQLMGRFLDGIRNRKYRKVLHEPFAGEPPR